MKSIKPGRGPSKLNMVASIGAALFGVFWCIMAVSMGAVFMVPFGLIFIGISLYQAVYSYHNVTSEDRYSIADIVDENEESDPYNERFGRRGNHGFIEADENLETEYCPYCGRRLEKDFEFCPKCGRQVR